MSTRFMLVLRPLLAKHLWSTRSVPPRSKAYCGKHVLSTSPRVHLTLAIPGETCFAHESSVSKAAVAAHVFQSTLALPIASIRVLERNAYLPPFFRSHLHPSTSACVCAPLALRFVQGWPPLAPPPAARHLHKKNIVEG